MLNKYFLIGILVVTGAMANMAFSSVNLQVSHSYEYGPAIAATGFASPALVSIQVPRSYEYGPAISATGFARPSVNGLQANRKLIPGR
jgi:hypothetical protein